jgi:integrase
MNRRVRITKRMVEGVEIPSSGEVNLWDSEVPGFSLRVRSTGSKVYVVEYRNRVQRKRRVTLGRHGKITVELARDLARQVLADVARGEDPAEARQSYRTAPTLEDLASRYMDEHASRKKKPASVEADASLLRLYILPALGQRKVAEIGSKHVADLHSSMRDVPFQANRVLALLSKMFNLAERWELRPRGENPCRFMDRFPEKRRERFLSSAEIARLGAVLDEVEAQEPFVVLAIRLILLTGARRDEILTLRWSEVDFERSVLRLADSKTGAKMIPLGPIVLALLAKAPRVEDNPYVIPGRRPGARFVGIHRPWARIREKAELEDVRIHDLRHSFASIGAAAGLGLPVLGAILGHSHPATTARYAHLADDPRRAAAARISNEIAAALSNRPAGEVIEFRKP